MDKVGRYNAMIVCECGVSAQAEIEDDKNAAAAPDEHNVQVFFVNAPLKLEFGQVVCGSCGKVVRGA